MSGLTKQQRAAVEAVARHFSATWEESEGPPDALTIAGKRIAIEVTTLRWRIADQDTKPRLRFDRVALRLVRRLQAALSGFVPGGKTLIVTITAPIRVPAKTAAELEDRIGADLGRRPGAVAARHTIHGNLIRVRLVKGGSNPSPGESEPRMERTAHGTQRRHRCKRHSSSAARRTSRRRPPRCSRC